MSMQSSRGGIPQHSAHTELVNPGNTSGQVGAGIACLGGVALIAAVIALISGATAFGASVGIGALITVGIGLFFYSRSKTEEQLWEPLELHFPVWGLPLGSLSNVTVIRASKKHLPDQADVRLLANVRCTEIVKYQVGSDERTEKREIVRDQLDLAGSIQNNTFTGTLGLMVPIDRGGPTLSLKHNSVKWEIGIQLGALSTMANEIEVDVSVIPELDDSQRTFIDSPPPPGGSSPQDA